jgi:Lrp/AsnC ligand binding domain
MASARFLRMAIQAYVFVSTTNPGPRAACLAVRRLDGVMRADALLGGPPVVAIVEADDLAALETIIDRIVDLPMVTDTETHVVRDLSEFA